MVSTGSFTHQLWELKLYADKQFILDVEKYTILLKDHMRDAMLKKHNKRFEFKPHEHLLNHKRFATWKEYREYYNIDKLSRIFFEICRNLEIPNPNEYHDKCQYDFENNKELDYHDSDDSDDEDDEDNQANQDNQDNDYYDNIINTEYTVYMVNGNNGNNGNNIIERGDNIGRGVARDIVFCFYSAPKYDAGSIKYNCLICMDVFNSGDWVYQCINCKDVIHLKCYQTAKKITTTVRCCICSRVDSEAVYIYTFLKDGVLVCRGENN